jgi:flagellar protein FliJ
MRRFQFRLERFLELKRYRERERELELARVQGECLLLKRRIEGIDTDVADSRGRQFASGPAVDIESMARRDLYIQRLLRERESTVVRLAEKTREMERVREKYLQAAKERKVLDKLKERRAEDYYEKQKDEEFKVIDDMNTASSLRQRW